MGKQRPSEKGRQLVTGQYLTIKKTINYNYALRIYLLVIEKNVKYFFRSYNFLLRECNFASEFGGGGGGASFLFLYLFLSLPLYLLIPLYLCLLISFFLYFLFIRSFFLSFFFFRILLFLAPAFKLFRDTWVNKLH